MNQEGQKDHTLELIRGIARPLLAIMSWIATIAFLVLGKEIPDAWWAILSAITTFYFVQRREEKREAAPPK